MNTEVTTVICCVVARNPLYTIITGMVLDLTTCRTEGANALRNGKAPGTTAKLERLADESTGRAGANAVAAEFAVERFAVDGVDNSGLAPVHYLDGVAADDLVIHLDAFFAEDAAIRVALDKWPVVADGPLLEHGRILLF